MQLILYEGFSKKKNSTKRPSGGRSVNVVMKNNTSIESPVFLIDGVDLDVNYCQFAGHYYFINDIVLGNNNIYELHCTQDLLATYKDYIGNYIAFVERSASNYNVNLYDSAITCSEQASNYVSTHATLSWFNSTGCYIVRVLGGAPATSKSGITSYVMSAADVQALMGIVFSEPGSSVFDDIIDVGEEAEKALARSIFNPAQFILSIFWLPVSKDSVPGTSHFLWLGNHRTDSSFKVVTSMGFSADTTIPVPPNTYGDFRDITEPFTTYTLYLGGVGAIPISAKDIVSGMKAVYSIDFLTGDTEVDVMTSGNKLISSYKTNLAVQIPIAGTVNDVSGVALSFAGALASAAAIRPVDAVDKLIEGNIHNVTPTPSIIGSQSSMTSIQAFPYVWLNKRVMGSGAIPTTVYGRPLCQNVQIGTLSGFVKCGGASIDIPSMASDRDEINTILNTGFYYE